MEEVNEEGVEDEEATKEIVIKVVVDIKEITKVVGVDTKEIIKEITKVDEVIKGIIKEVTKVVVEEVIKEITKVVAEVDIKVEDKKEAREVEEYKEQVGAVMEEEEETGEKEVDIVGEEEIGDNDTKSC